MADYRDEFYKRYDTATGVPTTIEVPKSVQRQFWARWRSHLPVDRTKSVLDLGCGAGDFLATLKARGYNRLLGIDLNRTHLDIAAQRGIEDLRLGSVMDLSHIEEGSIGCIVAFNLFEHLTKEEILHLLAEVHRILQPRGKLLIVVPNGVSPFGGSTRYWDFSHETGFTPSSWRQLSRLTGFSDVLFEDYGPIAYSAAGAVRTVLWKLVVLCLDAVSFIEVARPRDASRVYTADMKVILTK